MKVHSPDYIRFIHELDKQVNIDGKTVPFTPKVQKHIKRVDDDETKDQDDCDTSFSKGSLSAARRAVGAVCFAIDRVLSGANRNAFCAVRPPGHHAGLKGLIQGATSCGFCIFNNVAAGALHALNVHKLTRVAIVDLDVHHGNGTQEIIMEHASPDRLFFFSVHLYDHAPGNDSSKYEFYPGTGSRDRMEFNVVNAPLLPLWRRERGNNNINSQYGDKKKGVKRRRTTRHYRRAGRSSFRQTITERLVPSLRSFNPELILLSSGFDGARGDVGNNLKSSSSRTNGTSGIDLTPSDFYWATQQIQEVASVCCQGKVISVLEGGYGRQQKKGNQLMLDRRNFARCVLSQVAALVDHRLPSERVGKTMNGDITSDDDDDIMQSTRAGIGASDSEIDSDDGNGCYRIYDDREDKPLPCQELEKTEF